MHPDVAAQMATGVRAALALAAGPAHIGISTTGAAGPDPQDGHPVGQVYVGIAGPVGAEVRALTLVGGRAAIRAGSVTAALALLTDALLSGRFA